MFPSFPPLADNYHGAQCQLSPSDINLDKMTQVYSESAAVLQGESVLLVT